MKIALCGNPNVGKTTLFNRLTRSGAPVGNITGMPNRRDSSSKSTLPRASSIMLTMSATGFPASAICVKI